MKVFLVGDFPREDKTYGGVEGVLINLTDELIHRPNLELVLISTTADSGFSKYKNHCKTYNLNFRSSLFKAKRQFDAIVNKEKPEIIHLQGIVPGVLLYRKNYSHIFVVTQHAILKEERHWQVSIKRKALFRLKELIEKYYIKKIQNIVFISEYNQQLYFKNVENGKHLNCVRIPNPVNEKFYKHAKNLNGFNRNEMYFVGEIKKRKGLHILLKALSILKQRGINYKLHVIGGFKEKQYEHVIDKLISSLQLSDNIVFCGWKNQMDVIEYAKEIPIFVLPSLQETLPLSLAEAMCQGKIVVASDICGIPEMIQDKFSGYLFSKGNSAELADILKNVFENQDKQDEISENARCTSKKYLPKTIIDSTLNFYKCIVSKYS